jgi:hypothetical protein
MGERREAWHEHTVPDVIAKAKFTADSAGDSAL